MLKLISFELKEELIAFPTTNTQDYDQNSWKNIIPESCQSFNDGCNGCGRQDDGTIVCEEKYCENYTKPVCID